MQRDRLALAASGHLALGHLLDEPRQPLHLLAVEGGQHQLALAEVRALVEQDHRVRADDRLEDPRALARVQHLGRRGEDLAQVLRLRVVHERRRLQQPHREPLAVPVAGALEERHRARPPGDRLERARHPRPWRETHVRNVTASLARSVRWSTHERDSQGSCRFRGHGGDAGRSRRSVLRRRGRKRREPGRVPRGRRDHLRPVPLHRHAHHARLGAERGPLRERHGRRGRVRRPAGRRSSSTCGSAA